jgi:lycopene cyclase CruA
MAICLTPNEENVSSNIFTPYYKSHPLTVEQFESVPQGAYWFQRLLNYEHHSPNPIKQKTIPAISFAKKHNRKTDFDIIYAGGGLAVIHAAVMSCVYGYRVCIFDQYHVGYTHRDWNISMAEIKKIVDVGLLSDKELHKVIAKFYSLGGFIKFNDTNSSVKTPPLWMHDVLDIAIDANTLLHICREKLENSENTIFDNSKFLHVTSHIDSVSVTIERDGNPIEITSRIFVDSMGAFSPVSKQLNPKRHLTHCCPTVGTIASNYKIGENHDEVNPEVGEILLTLDDADETGRQLIWEGFPGKDNSFITYLFFYDEITSKQNRSLLSLYEIFFKQIHTYKKADTNFIVNRPLFGIIPSYLHKSLFQEKNIATNNILCLGDAAGLSSPLTYCGFGSFIRNLDRTTSILDHCLKLNKTDTKNLSQVTAYEANVSIAANFAQFLVGKSHFPKQAVNETMNIILDILNDLPANISAELFRDSLTWESYNTLMSTVPKKHPQAYKFLLRHHGVEGLFWWLTNFFGFSIDKLRGRVR